MIIQIGYIVRVGNFDTGFRFFVFDVPVHVVGIFVELQCQFVMVVTLGIIVVSDIFTQHEAVNNVTVAHPAVNIGNIVGFYFDVSTIGLLVFIEFIFGLVVQSRCIQFFITVCVLLFVFSFSLHVFIEEECFVGFSMSQFGIVRPLAVIFRFRYRDSFFVVVDVVIIRFTFRDTCRPMFIVACSFGIRNAFAICYKVSIIFNVIIWIPVDGAFLAQIAFRRYVLDGNRLEVDIYILVKVGTVVGNGHFGSGTAYPGVQFDGCPVYNCHFIVLHASCNGEIAEHLVVVGYFIPIPLEGNAFQAVCGFYGFGIVIIRKQVLHIGHRINPIASVGDFQFEVGMGRLCFGGRKIRVGIIIRSVFIFQLILPFACSFGKRI